MMELGLDQCTFEPASADASFRRYFRIGPTSGDQSWVVMDAPPEQENSEPFVRIARLLAQAGLHVPQIIAKDMARGFLLLSDLGHQTYLNVLDAENAEALFSDAIDALIQIQLCPVPAGFPAYDRELLQRELSLFPDWYIRRERARGLTAPQLQAWQQVCETLVDSALSQPRVLVHRDFMPRNLMISTPQPGVLDFQDAVLGPVTYDVVCLFKDAFLSWPQSRIDAWQQLYLARAQSAGIVLPEDFQRSLDLMGVQRHLKVLGIFARICHRDGKPKYLEDTPRFLRYILDVAPRYPELQPLAVLFSELGLES